ncbi:MAG: hypothetical protein K2L39_00855 [Muribaculaceae bacterium]|nr:hypothetical protein [Muribaculaceae bacterium]MDE6359763.1 hypothetical protein [Muribaculaceae bacterium]
MRTRLTGLLAALAIAGMPLAAATPSWEEVTSPQTSVVQSFEMEGQTEVMVRDGYIYIWSQKPVTVKLFSILGQQIHQETVQPGIHRLKLNSKGIFILKAGSLTKRVTL